MSPFGRIFGTTDRAVAQLVALALASIAAAPARAQTPVQFGDVITAPGVYFLAGNQSGSGTGIDIQTNDVTLLLTRFTLRGDGTGQGIISLGYDRVAVFGGRVTNFQTGVYLSTSDESSLNGVRVDYCSTGVHVQNSYENSFLRSRFDHNGGHGIEAYDLYEARFVSILAHDNGGDGILLRNQSVGMAVSTNKVRLCWCAVNGRSGIHVVDAHDNDISRNECVGNDGAGIYLESMNTPPPVAGSAAVDSTRDNHLTSNWCVFNFDGIVVGSGATSNTMTNNTALANFQDDMLDANVAPPCANLWFLNTFFTKDGAGASCIF